MYGGLFKFRFVLKVYLHPSHSTEACPCIAAKGQFHMSYDSLSTNIRLILVNTGYFFEEITQGGGAQTPAPPKIPFIS